LAYKKVDWDTEFKNVVEMAKQGKTNVAIAKHFGVSPERIRQVFFKKRKTKEFQDFLAFLTQKEEEKQRLHFDKWGDTSQEFYEEKRIKFFRKKANAVKKGHEFTIKFSEITFPKYCPILGIELDYFAEGRQENSVSFDRRDSSKGYVKGNVEVVSWRANRIKNDGTAEEHRKIADYIDSHLKT
jgi:hypothetical protein